MKILAKIQFYKIGSGCIGSRLHLHRSIMEKLNLENNRDTLFKVDKINNVLTIERTDCLDFKTIDNENEFITMVTAQMYASGGSKSKSVRFHFPLKVIEYLNITVEDRDVSVKFDEDTKIITLKKITLKELFPVIDGIKLGSIDADMSLLLQKKCKITDINEFLKSECKKDWGLELTSAESVRKLEKLLNSNMYETIEEWIREKVRNTIKNEIVK